ncbi:MAG TPA: hypothetical protein PK466_03410 [Thermotogota bacterium]|nr:hypothetical protein [Thermotogota bacterium]HPJ88303.1 hypothetical protein [Thermotogota bacterium]HPR95350.1 hypothetical protein [Thermotogota bacterium]
MKKRILSLTALAVVLFLMTFLVSCRVSSPDIDNPSVHYMSATEVELWWDYESVTVPFVLSIRDTEVASMTDHNLPAPPYTMAVESGKTYEWKVTGNNGAVGGLWEFTVP